MIPKQPINSMRVYGTTSQYTTPPSNSEIDAGVEPLDSLPADWWNWLWNQVTLEEGHTVQFCNSLFAEISTVLSAAGVYPKEANTNDLLNAIYKITRTIATTETAGAIKSSIKSGRIYVDVNEGWADVMGLGTPSSLNTTSKEVVGAINELKAAISDLNTALTDLIIDKADTERAERIAADTSLQTSITALDSAAVKSVNSVKPTNGNVDITVDSAVLKDSSVTESKIATSAVTESKIATSAVTGDKLASSAVTTAKIDTGAVTTAKIADNAVTNDKIAGTLPIAKGGTGAVTAVQGFKNLAAGISESTLFIQEDDPLLYQSGGLTWKKASFMTALKSLWSIFNTEQPAEFPASYLSECLEWDIYGCRQSLSKLCVRVATYSSSTLSIARNINDRTLTVAASGPGFTYSALGGGGKTVLHGKGSCFYTSCTIALLDKVPVIFLSMTDKDQDNTYIIAYDVADKRYISSDGTKTSTFSIYATSTDIASGSQIGSTNRFLYLVGLEGSVLGAYRRPISTDSVSFTEITLPDTSSGDTPNQVGRICSTSSYVIVPTNFSGLYEIEGNSTTATLLTYDGSTRNDYFNAVAVNSSDTIVAVGSIVVYGTVGSLTRISLGKVAVAVAYIDPDDIFIIIHIDGTYSLFDANTGSFLTYASQLSSSSKHDVVYNKDAHTLIVTAVSSPLSIYTIPAKSNSLFKINTPGTLEVPSVISLMNRVSWLEQQVSKLT